MSLTRQPLKYLRTHHNVEQRDLNCNSDLTKEPEVAREALFLSLKTNKHTPLSDAYLNMCRLYLRSILSGIGFKIQWMGGVGRDIDEKRSAMS